jgi:4-diphosphocytidyl-2-C-methyl-D-erythritol kinase
LSPGAEALPTEATTEAPDDAGPGGLVWPAPAKLNLFLHVTGRRPDGYHELQTAFQFIGLCDEITLGLRADGAIERAGELPGVPPEEDLTVRAARALKAASGAVGGVTIGVRKRIPMGGGLGGGSSDAATVLVALNALWGIDWPPGRLAGLGLGLGADVPVFVHGHAAWAEGVGERLAPLSPPEQWFVLLRPDCAIATARIFNDPRLTRDTPPQRIPAFADGFGHNDCEPVVRALHPEVAAAIDWLSDHVPARLTGTGSCVFGRCGTGPAGEARARDLAAAAQAQGLVSFAVRGLNRSPLLEALAHWRSLGRQG